MCYHAEFFAGANSHSSSRPSSGSRRRRRPASKPSSANDAAATVKKSRGGHSSEEYASSDNDSIYSEDSLGLTHPSEQQEAVVSQDDLEASSAPELGSDLYVCEDPAGSGVSEDEDAMAGTRRTSVHALVSFFESQFAQAQEKTRKDQRPNRQSRRPSSTSVLSDDGNSSSSESTQTAGCSVVMSKTPVSTLSTGDPVSVVSSGAFRATCGVQNAREPTSSSYRPRKRSTLLSLTAVDTWHSPSLQDDGAEVDEQCPDAVFKRRSSKADLFTCPKKRQRQEKLEGLGTKYGLTDDADRMSDDEDTHEPEEHSTQHRSSASPSRPERDLARSESSTHKQVRAFQTDEDGKLRFEVTINKDETSVLYNVEKTEYKTYSIKDRAEEDDNEAVSSTAIPESINVNLTETTTHQREDHFQTLTKERVIFDGGEGEANKTDGVIVMERTFSGGHVLDFEQDRVGDDVSRESSVERRMTDEDSSTSLKMISQEPSAVLQPALSQSGVEQNTCDDGRDPQTHTSVTDVLAPNSETRHEEDGGLGNATRTTATVHVSTSSHDTKSIAPAELVTVGRSDDGSVLHVQSSVPIDLPVVVVRPPAGSDERDAGGTEDSPEKRVEIPVVHVHGESDRVPQGLISSGNLQLDEALYSSQSKSEDDVNDSDRNGKDRAVEKRQNAVPGCGDRDAIAMDTPSVNEASASERTTSVGHLNTTLIDPLSHSDTAATPLSAEARQGQEESGSAVSNHTLPAEGVSHGANSDDLICSSEDSFHSTANSQSRDPRSLWNENSAGIAFSLNGQDAAASSSEMSEDFYYSAPSSDDVPHGRPDFSSTPLSSASSPTPSQSGPAADPGRLRVQSDSSMPTSAEESFYSPDTTIHSSSGSSVSSEYRTPQQSPRESHSYQQGRTDGTREAMILDPDQTSTCISLQNDEGSHQDGSQRPSLSKTPPRPESRQRTSTRHQDTSRLNGEPGLAVSQQPPVADDDVRLDNEDVDGGDERTVVGATGILSAMAAAVGRQLLGDEGQVEAMREVLKQEVGTAFIQLNGPL